MEIKRDKKNFDEWLSVLEAWLLNNGNLFDTNISEFDKKYVNEYMDNYFGKSEFLDSYFGAIKDYLTAVMNPDKPQKEKEDLLKQALSKAQESQKTGNPHSEYYGINSLIIAITEALDVLNNSSNTTSQTQNP